MKSECALEDKLKPLAQAGAVVHFAFFANTFPLGYHYFKVVRDQREQSKKMGLPDALKDLELVRIHDWSDPTPHFAPDLPNVFYATAETIESIEKDPQEFGLVEPPAKSPFTYYNPLFVFLKYSTSLAGVDAKARLEYRKSSAIIDSSQDTCPELSQVLPRFIRHYEVIEIFTDIPEQAKLLVALLEQRGVDREKTFTIFNWNGCLNFPLPQKKVLKMLFYGAPVASALRQDPLRFICFGLALPPNLPPGDRKKLETYVCVTAKDHSQAEDFASKLKAYHQSLFELAENDPEGLVNVWWAYNRYAELRQHNSQFANAKAYASCLRDHHKPLSG